MNDSVNESPFEKSTLQPQSSLTSSPFGSTPASGEGVEVRYPAAQRIVVPAALLFSAIVAPAAVFFIVQPPLNVIIAAVLAVAELSTTAFMWFLFSSAFVRADENGITKSQMGQTKSVRWEEIGGVEMQQTTTSRPPRTEWMLKDLEGKTLLQFSDFGDRENGERLAEYIAQKREQRS
jgi:hypothetical protein